MDVSTAEPIAKPLPVAAVVLPSASSEGSAGQACKYETLRRLDARRLLRGETHLYVYLLVAGRKLTQEKKNLARAGRPSRKHRDAYLSQLGPPSRRGREPCDQRDVVGRELLGRQPVAELFQGRRLESTDRHQI